MAAAEPKYYVYDEDHVELVGDAVMVPGSEDESGIETDRNPTPCEA